MTLIQINQKYAANVNSTFDEMLKSAEKHNADCGFGEITNTEKNRLAREAKQWVFENIAERDGITANEWHMAHAERFLELERG